MTPTGTLTTDLPDAPVRQSAPRSATFAVPVMARVWLVALSLGINLVALVLPLSILQLYDRIIPNHAVETLAALILGIFLAQLAEAALTYARAERIAWHAARFEHGVSVTMFERLLFSDLVDGGSKRPARLAKQFLWVGRIKDHYAGGTLGLLLDLPFLVVFLGLMALIGGWIALIPPALFLAVFGAVQLRHARNRDELGELDAALGAQLDFSLHALGAIGHIKALGLEAAIQRRFESRVRRLGLARRMVGRGQVAGQTAQAALSGLTMICVAAAGALGVIRGDLTMGELAASTLLANRAMQPLQRLIGGWSASRQMVTGRRHVADGMARPVRAALSEAALPHQIKGGLALENVTLAPYPGRPPLLREVTFGIQPGELIVLAGRTGSGRTRLLLMLAGLIDPAAGRVLLDGGRDLSSLAVADVERNIVLVPPRPPIYAGTFLENITQFDDPRRIDHAHAYAAADRMGLTALAGRLPQGFDTLVGPGSQYHLPEGVAQRLGLAQALYLDAPVLLIDRANSALDSAGNDQFLKMLADLKGRRTVILVSETDMPDGLADRVLRIENQQLTPSIQLAEVG